MPYHFVLLAALTLVGVQDTATLKVDDALEASARGDSARAIEILDRIIAENGKSATAYYLRGRERFKVGRIEDSIVDFDRFVALEPKASSRQWERGISLYYAQRYAEGAKQFEEYQTFHDQDVENSAWRYLCTARSEGVAKAQANLLPIENDRRIPMMTIYEFYRGKASADDVFAAAEGGEASEAERKVRRFYAHLYVGLHHEAAGRAEEAKKHLVLAAERYQIDHYMGDVARVHADRLLNKERTEKASSGK